ncbi:MAG TPA: putative nucleotidyltransferase substrate binding domain-containing protein [Solirubrobacterales bacterium]
MHDIAEFLRGLDPFSGLDEGALERLASHTEVEFFAAGTTIVPQGQTSPVKVRVVRRGSVELLDGGRVVDLLGEGEMFGHPSVLSGLPARFESRAREDSLCYALSASDVVPLLGRRPGLRFLARSLLDRGELLAVEAERARETAQQPAAALVRRPPVICEPDLSIREAARRMVDEGVSSVLVRLDGGRFGIVTDGDLRSRVVAEGVTGDAPVSEAMTAPVVGVDAEQTGADVMLTMLDHDIRHVPVFSSRSEILGVIVGIDLVAAETRAPLLLRREIARATSKQELQAAAKRLSSTVIALHRAELPSGQISAVISAVADSLIRRMIEMGIDSEGPPPAEFAWLSLGSHGRREPVPSSDIDSGLAWREEAGSDPTSSQARRRLASAGTAEYMHALAGDVADCVRVIGWRLDPHGVTASGTFSASSIEDWRRSIESWLDKPSDNRVLIATSVLLDGRVVHGPADDLDVTALLHEQARNRPVLLEWMLRLALALKPPTGFLRDIVVEGSGEHRGTFDIKHGGLMPIVDLARYAALKAGTRVTATVERLHAAEAEGVLDSTQSGILEEAYELFSAIRLQHQVEQLEAKKDPDDHLEPKLLNPLTRRYLRDAFREVAAVQRTAARDLAPRR